MNVDQVSRQKLRIVFIFVRPELIVCWQKGTKSQCIHKKHVILCVQTKSIYLLWEVFMSLNKKMACANGTFRISYAWSMCICVYKSCRLHLTYIDSSLVNQTIAGMEYQIVWTVNSTVERTSFYLSETALFFLCFSNGLVSMSR